MKRLVVRFFYKLTGDIESITMDRELAHLQRMTA